MPRNNKISIARVIEEVGRRSPSKRSKKRPRAFSPDDFPSTRRKSTPEQKHISDAELIMKFHKRVPQETLEQPKPKHVREEPKKPIQLRLFSSEAKRDETGPVLEQNPGTNPGHSHHWLFSPNPVPPQHDVVVLAGKNLILTNQVDSYFK